jgi:hypothetical protein
MGCDLLMEIPFTTLKVIFNLLPLQNYVRLLLIQIFGNKEMT